MAAGRLQQPGSERARLDPFDALAGDVPPRDQRDLMERPFFSLAKTKRTAPILYTAGDTQVQVHGLPEHGIATIWDADVLIWAASHLVEALDRGLPTSRFFRFTPYQLLGAIGRGRGQRDYLLLKGALARLQSTVIRTTIRHGAHWRRQQFSWISEWEELTTWSGRVEGMEFVLPDWFYQGVLDRRLVLTVDPAYFRLTGGLERWLYRVARKHAGRQPGGWRFELRHLHAKSASLARFSDFALDVRRLVARQPLPGYALALRQEDAGRPLLHIRPVDNLWTSAAGHGTSGASDIGTSGAPDTGLRAQESPDPSARSMRCGSRNFSNQESNRKEVVGPARCAERDRDGERGAVP
ncbi:MAG: replication initiator protein A [Hyphomicrobiaceae bacterium]|nr:replication initiator protein A [Hyphomicrobiaceae bacterium]